MNPYLYAITVFVYFHIGWWLRCDMIRRFQPKHGYDFDHVTLFWPLVLPIIVAESLMPDEES